MNLIGGERRQAMDPQAVHLEKLVLGTATTEGAVTRHDPRNYGPGRMVRFCIRQVLADGTVHRSAPMWIFWPDSEEDRAKAREICGPELEILGP